MQKPVLIASAALICAAVIGIAVYATGSRRSCAMPRSSMPVRASW